MTFRELAIIVLQSETEPLSTNQIWNKAKILDLQSKLKGNGKNPYATFSSVLYTDFKRKNSKFVVHSSNPKKFSLRK